MDLRSQLIRDEGVRLKPYRDTVGKLTIGVGRNLDDVGISRREAEFLLDNDIDRATAALAVALPWTMELDDVRRSVLVNMAFNVGMTRLLGFKKMLAAAQKGDYVIASAEMLDSAWHTQVGVRAERLAKQMRTGELV